MESRALIVGAGEIGKSMFSVLDGKFDVHIRDKDSGPTGQFNYLHVCIPYSEEFLSEVERYDYEYSPKIIVIHSTVPLGTIRKLGDKAVHVPIRGKHPNLAESIRKFRLYVGGNNRDYVTEIADMFRQVVDDVYMIDTTYPPETTELLKIMCTTYYGWNILFEKEMYRLCNELGVPYEVVYTDLNRTYNLGYTKAGMGQFTRPVLDHMPGPIGGHCVSNNCRLFPDSYITKLILEKDEEFKNE